MWIGNIRDLRVSTVDKLTADIDAFCPVLRSNREAVDQMHIGKEGNHPGLDVTVELLKLIILLLVEVNAAPKRIEMKDELLERTRPRVVNVEDGRGVGSRHFG
jgi:hypothetical protein